MNGESLLVKDQDTNATFAATIQDLQDKIDSVKEFQKEHGNNYPLLWNSNTLTNLKKSCDLMSNLINSVHKAKAAEARHASLAKSLAHCIYSEMQCPQNPETFSRILADIAENHNIDFRKFAGDPDSQRLESWLVMFSDLHKICVDILQKHYFTMGYSRRPGEDLIIKVTIHDYFSKFAGPDYDLW